MIMIGTSRKEGGARSLDSREANVLYVAGLEFLLCRSNCWVLTLES